MYTHIYVYKYIHTHSLTNRISCTARKPYSTILFASLLQTCFGYFYKVELTPGTYKKCSIYLRLICIASISPLCHRIWQKKLEFSLVDQNHFSGLNAFVRWLNHHFIHFFWLKYGLMKCTVLLGYPFFLVKYRFMVKQMSPLSLSLHRHLGFFLGVKLSHVPSQLDCDHP